MVAERGYDITPAGQVVVLQPRNRPAAEKIVSLAEEIVKTSALIAERRERDKPRQNDRDK